MALATLLCSAALAVAASTSGAATSRELHSTHWTPAAGIGDQCIVGEWRDQAGDGGKVHWQGQVVTMYGGAGAIESDSLDGTAVTHYADAKPFTGYAGAYKLTMTIRGKAEGVVHFNAATAGYRFEGTNLVNYRVTFKYRGKTTTGTAGPVPWYQSGYYSCSGDSYTDNKGSSTRISTTP